MSNVVLDLQKLETGDDKIKMPNSGSSSSSSSSSLAHSSLSIFC